MHLFRFTLLSVLLMAITANFAYGEQVVIETNLPGVGNLSLVGRVKEGVESSQLVLQRSNETSKHLIDSFEGLLPKKILKHDLNADGNTDVIVVLTHPDEITLQPYIYSNTKKLTRVFPEKDVEINPLFCNEVFVSASRTGTPLLGINNKINYHDFGPPHLVRTELYALRKGKLVLMEEALSKNNHFNVLMNKGAIALQKGQYQEAIKYYNQSITSSTGDLTTRAFLEAVYYLAEANKFASNFKEACELYEKIVLEFSENVFTDISQREIEFINANLDNTQALAYYLSIISEINCNNWNNALVKVQQNSIISKNNKLKDRFLLAKAEILIALNEIDEATQIYNLIKTNYPNSPIIETVNYLLEDISLQVENGLGL